MNWINQYFTNVRWSEIGGATVDTLSMLAGSLSLTVVFGLPLGVILFLLGPKQLLDSPRIYVSHPGRSYGRL